MFRMTIMARELTSAIQAAQSVTSSGIKVAILKCTRIEIDDGTATFIATNQDQALRTRRAVEGFGIIHLDTAMLASKCSSLRQDQQVSIVEEDGFAIVTQGRTKWKLPVLGGDDWPDLVAEEIPGNGFTIACALLLRGIRSTRPFVEMGSAARYELSGIRFDFEDGFRMVSTNGKALSVFFVSPDKATSFTAPIEATAVIERLFALAGMLEIKSDDRAFTVSDGTTLLRSKQVDGAYPNWRRIIPDHRDNTVVVGSADFASAVKRAIAIKEDENKMGNFVPVIMDVEDRELRILASNNVGEAGEDYSACELTGNAARIGFNSAHLIAAVNSLADADTVSFSYSNPRDPVVVRRVGSDTEDFRILSPRAV